MYHLAAVHAVHSRHNVEVPEKPCSDGISAAAGGSARADEDHVDDLPELQGLTVIPDGDK